MNGLHLDLKWPLYSWDYLRSVLTTARSLGIDTLLLEFENKIRLDGFERAVHPDHWTASDVKKFLRLARAKGITVIPKVPLMGHLEWLLQWPWWSHLQENHDRREICPSHPETPALLARLLDTVLDLFPDTPMIHLGGDETFSLGSCPKCKGRKQSKGEIYLDHYRPLIRQAESAGRRVLIYSDMILAHPEIINRIPRSVVVCDWDYWSGAFPGRNIWGFKGKEPGESWSDVPEHLRHYERYFTRPDGTLQEFPYARFLKEAGFDVVTFSAAKASGDNYCAPRTAMHVRNVMAGAKRARELDLLGTLVTSWAPRFNHLETNWPALAASAWTYRDPGLGYAAGSERFAKEFFGGDWPGIFDDLDKLSPELPDLHAYAPDPFPPDVVHRCITTMYRDPDGPACKAIRDNLAKVQASYRRGLAILQKNQGKIRKNKSMYTHWLLAAHTLVHKARVVPTLVKLAQGKKVSSTVRAGFTKEITRLADRHRKLFRPTMGPVSLEMEINLRFSETMELLKGNTR